MAKTAKTERSLVPSRHKMNLTTLAGVLNEQTRVYRLLLNGRIKADMASKMGFMLDKIRSSVEGLPPEPMLYGPGFGGEINIISIEAGRYITRNAIDRLISGENIYSIAPGDLLYPLTIEHQPVGTEYVQPTMADVIPLHPAEAVEEAPTTENIEDLIKSYGELSAKVESGVAIEIETAPIVPAPHQ